MEAPGIPGVADRHALKNGLSVPYSPGWTDRLIGWIRNLPIPGWLFYLGVWLLLSAVETAVKWFDGTYPVGEYSAYHTLPQFTLVYALAMMQHLDQLASKALAHARPALNVDDSQYRQLLYRLTVLPARPTLLASLSGMLFGFFVFLTSQELFDDLKIFTSPLASVVEFFIGLVLLYGTWGALIYHTVRQLGLVNDIYERHARVDLFELGPLYAFSGLTARTSAGLAFSVVPWLILVPEAFSSTVGGIVYLVGMLLVCVVAFIWPLLGVHSLMVEEKARREREQHLQMQAAIADLHRRMTAGELADIGTLKTGMDALVLEESVLDKISTWPWRAGTVRGLAASLFLPIVIWLATRLLERLGL